MHVLLVFVFKTPTRVHTSPPHPNVPNRNFCALLKVVSPKTVLGPKAKITLRQVQLYGIVDKTKCRYFVSRVKATHPPSIFGSNSWAFHCALHAILKKLIISISTHMLFSFVFMRAQAIVTVDFHHCSWILWLFCLCGVKSTLSRDFQARICVRTSVLGKMDTCMDTYWQWLSCTVDNYSSTCVIRICLFQTHKQFEQK